MNAACTFSNTVSLGKMFVRWNERPIPSRQTSCGAMPVMSRPSRSTEPVSARRWPVMRLKNVVLPAPLGPMMAAICPRATPRLTPPTAWKPSNDLRMSRTSSTARPQAVPGGVERAHDPARKHEEQHDEDAAEDEGPVLRVRGDLLVEHEEDEGAHGGPVEVAHPAQNGHDEDLGRFGPVREVGEHAAVEDAEETARETGEGTRDDEGEQLVAPHVDADELRPFGILPDRGQDAAEGRAYHPAQEPQARGHQHHRHQVEVVARAQRVDEREFLHPGQI